MDACKYLKLPSTQQRKLDVVNLSCREEELEENNRQPGPTSKGWQLGAERPPCMVGNIGIGIGIGF